MKDIWLAYVRWSIWIGSQICSIPLDQATANYCYFVCFIINILLFSVLTQRAHLSFFLTLVLLPFFLSFFPAPTPPRALEIKTPFQLWHVGPDLEENACLQLYALSCHLFGIPFFPENFHAFSGGLVIAASAREAEALESPTEVWWIK